MQLANPPSNTRAFFDPDKLREKMFHNAIEGFSKKLNQIELPDYKLRVTNLKVEQPSISVADKKKAVLEKKDLVVPLKATVELIHKATNKVIETKTTTIAHIPYLTAHNTVIYNGSEYEAINQQRLLPGIYHRIRQDGIPEAHINPAPKTGQSARIMFLPDKQLFILMVKNSQVRLYGVLKDLGITDASMKATWGEKIFNINRQLYQGDEIDKLYSLLIKSY